MKRSYPPSYHAPPVSRELRNIAYIAAVAVILLFLAIFLPINALAQEQVPNDDTVIVPWGDWLSWVLNYALELIMLAIGAVVTWLLARLPAGITAVVTPERVNQLLEKALQYAINTTAEAVKGKTWDAKVTNDILEKALEYAVTHAPDLVKWAGGPDLVKQKLVARLGEVKATPDAEKGTAASQLTKEASDTLDANT